MEWGGERWGCNLKRLVRETPLRRRPPQDSREVKGQPRGARSQPFLLLPVWSSEAFEFVTLLFTPADGGCGNRSSDSDLGWEKARVVGCG